jgi:regulatory protein
LLLLARRELTSTQLRDRLTKKGFTPEAVSDTIQRLTEEGALDDRRTANIYARQAVLVKHRGPRRAILDIVAIGISQDIAREVVSQTYEEVDIHLVIQRALDRRLNGRVQNRNQFQKLYQYLVRQGFDGPLAYTVLKKHSACSTDLDE